jgi:hypothetical protein
VKRKKITGKMVVGKLQVIRERTKMKSKSDIAKTYGIPLSTLLSYLKNTIPVQGCDILKHMRIHEAKNLNMENELFVRFCHAENNSMTGFAMLKKTILQWMAKQ